MANQDAEAGDPFSSAGGASAFDIAAFLQTALRLWWIPLGSLVLGILAGFILVKTAKPEYVATSELKVERRASTSAISLSGSPLSFEGATAPEDLKTIEKSFVNPMLMNRVVQEIKSAGMEGLTLGGWPINKLDDAGIAGFLMKDCTVSLIPETRLIQVSFSNPDPIMAQRICNLIVEQGIDYDRDQRISAVGVNIRYLKDEVKKMEENLRTSEEKLNAYTRTLRNVSIDSDMNIVANQFKELDARTTQAKTERLRLESDLAQIQACGNDPKLLLKLDSVQKLPSIISLNSAIAESKNKLAKLSLRYRDDNPYMKQARSELAALEASFLQAVLSAPQQAEAALALAKKNEENLTRERASQEEKVIQVRDLSVPSRVLQRQIDADRLAYEAALKRLSEELSQARSQPVLLQVVNPAGPGYPAGSKPLKLFGVALVLSLMAGFGIIFLITQLDSSLKTAEEAEKLLSLSTLSAIPQHIPPKDAPPPTEASWENCPVLSDKFSSTAEAIRSLRAGLRALEDETPGNLILITSAVDNDGKTFSAVNLAISMAQAGQRTLLVDADLRQPMLERIVFGGGHRNGLSNHLQNQCGLPSVIHSSSLPNLDLVPAGTPCEFPAETLTRQGMLQFLNEAAPIYDKIVVDSAPVTTVSDTLSFARLFSFVCVVVRAGKTPRASASRAAELLRRANAKLSGLVLNSAPRPFQSPLATSDSDRPLRQPTSLSCPSCGKTYDSLADCLARTEAAPGTASTSPRSPQRKCSCGAIFAPSVGNQRDESREGTQRRKLFGELIALLEAGGMDRDSARRELLLTLKVWRHEMAAESKNETSAASQERSRLFAHLAGYLVRSGLSPEHARDSLLQAVEAWRKTP